MIRSLDHLVLTVADMDKTVDFYERVMGMQARAFGTGRMAVHYGTQKINLHPIENDVSIKAARPTPGSADLCFLADRPMDEILAHLAREGVTIELAPSRRDGATGPIHSVYFRDPDDNLIEVSVPL